MFVAGKLVGQVWHCRQEVSLAQKGQRGKPQDTFLRMLLPTWKTATRRELQVLECNKMMAKQLRVGMFQNDMSCLGRNQNELAKQSLLKF